MQEKQNTNEEETPVILTPDQEKELVSKELAQIPEGEKAEIMKVVKTADIVIIDAHKKKVTSFKRRFPAKNFAITPDIVFTKDALEKATEQWREIKNHRTKVAQVQFDALKAPYIAITKFYNEQTKPIIDELKAIEKPISDYVDKLEQLQKEEAQKEKIKAEALANERRDKFMAAGMYFDGNHYVIGSEEFEVPQISFDMADFQTMTDAICERALQQVTESAEKINRLAAEKKQREEDAEKKRKEEEAEQNRKNEELRLENEKKEQELKKQEEEMKKQRIEIRGEALELLGFVHNVGTKNYSFSTYVISEEDVASFDKANWDNWLNEAKKGIARFITIKNRAAELIALGMAFNEIKKEYTYNNISVSTHYIEEATAGGWEECIFDTKEKIDLKKAELIREENAKIAKDKLRSERISSIGQYIAFGEPVNGDVADLSVTEFDALLAGKKAAYDKKIQDDIDSQKKEEENKKKEELAKSSDSTKWAAFLQHIKNVPVLEMESEEYKFKYKNALAILTAIK